MKPRDLLKQHNYPSILIYGPAGSFKTALVSQAKNAYLFDFDDGMRTAAQMNDNFFDLRQDIDFDIYKDKKPSSPNKWLEAEKKINKLSEQNANGKLDKSAIIIDSLSGMAKCMQLHVMNMAGDPFKKPQIQHWGTLVSTMEKALTILRSLDCLLIITAHETSLEVDGMNLIRPLSVTQKHSLNKLEWLFDEVWHTRIRPAGGNKQKFMLTGKGSTSISARTRSGIIDEIDLTKTPLSKILERIGYKEEENEKSSNG